MNLKEQAENHAFYWLSAFTIAGFAAGFHARSYFPPSKESATSVAPSPEPAGSRLYTLAGERGPASPIRVDDFVEVRLNGVLLAILRGQKTPSGQLFDIPAYSLRGKPGELLGVDAVDDGGGYFLDSVYLYSDTGVVTQITPGVEKCSLLPNFPCPHPKMGQPRRFIQARLQLP